ncbi:hypothetical protein RhiirA5_399175 [Rhizophagus irregularis]|uniref:Myb-like domain-containing protein n=1 Tax=Rhizophagus irregularis TaxID=588596 RepID=A0A2N0PPA9_9GLOM|nr:hypothetical protein RhiirA5_399175 [Rhizophagus irregularis]
MGKDTPTKVVKEESMESIEYDTNSGQDEEMKDVEHVTIKQETQITPPPPSQSATSLDQQKISSETVGLQQQQQTTSTSSSTSPLTPPSTQPEATNEIEQPKVTKKRGRKTTAKPATSVKRKKTTTKKVEKVEESENDMKLKKDDEKLKDVKLKEGEKIKEDESNSSLGVFDFTESDDESEDVDQLMPSSKSSSKKKSSVNNQKSTTKKSSKKSSTETKKIKSPWQPDEDKILIDKILGEMPSPSWSKISQSLKDRNANACLRDNNNEGSKKILKEMNNELGDNNNIESDEGKNIKFDPINELDDDEKISTSFTINESDDEKKSSVNNEENEDFIFEKQIIPLSANQVNDESGTSEIRHVKSNGSVPEDDQKFTISYHSAKMKYESGLEYNKKIAIKYEEMIKISKKLKPSIQGNEKQSDIKYEEVIKSNASGAYPTRLIQDKNNIVEYEGVVKNNNKKLVDNNDVIKENEESEKNLRETHQSIFVGSDFKVISKRLDELRPDSADSVKLDDDKKISVNNTTINGSNNEKILLVNNQKNDESIIEEHITPLSTNQVNNDESGALEIQYVKSNEFFSENKNLDAPINTAFLEKNNFHIKGDINSDQMKYKSGSRYNKKIVTKYEEMTKNNKKLTQTCIIPDRILHGSCVRNHRQFLLNTENHVLRCFGITRSPNDNTELAKWLKKDAKDAKERPKLNSELNICYPSSKSGMRKRFGDSRIHCSSFAKTLLYMEYELVYCYEQVTAMGVSSSA